MENVGMALPQHYTLHTTRHDRRHRHDTTRQDKTRQDKTRQDKTRQDKTRTRQDRTRQDKTRQDKTRQDNRIEYKQSMFDCAHDVGGSGAARRRRDGRLRMHWRHEQLSLRMLLASVGHKLPAVPGVSRRSDCTSSSGRVRCSCSNGRTHYSISCRTRSTCTRRSSACRDPRRDRHARTSEHRIRDARTC